MPDDRGQTGAARRLRAVVLLAGQVGRNPLADAIGRSILDLPVGDGRAVLDVWLERLDGLAVALGQGDLLCHVAVDRAGELPRERTGSPEGRVRLQVGRDPGEYRGTAGVVRDLSRGFDDDDWILVAAANQIVGEPLEGVFADLAAAGESVSIVPVAGSEFASLFLLRCGRLAEVPEIGFVDLKEQAIPAARGRAPLRVVRREAGASRPVRTLAEYIRALRAVHGGAAGAGDDDPLAETWQPVFAIVEDGADVASGAVVQDSVVLRGARVEGGAALARSVVCAGGIVRRPDCLVETLVTGDR